MQIPKVLLVNDDAASLFALESLLTSDTRAEPVRAGHRHLRPRSAAQGADPRIRRHPAGREHAGHGRLRDRRGDPLAPALRSSVPIIFITAYYADEMHRLKAYQSGAADYLFTPVIPQVLQTKVARVRRPDPQEPRTARQDRRTVAASTRTCASSACRTSNASTRELEQEVAERKLAEQRAHELSIRDALTGLVNRRSLIQQLEHAVASCDRHQGEFALLFLDLDQLQAGQRHARPRGRRRAAAPGRGAPAGGGARLGRGGAPGRRRIRRPARRQRRGRQCGAGGAQDRAGPRASRSTSTATASRPAPASASRCTRRTPPTPPR